MGVIKPGAGVSLTRQNQKHGLWFRCGPLAVQTQLVCGLRMSPVTLSQVISVRWQLKEVINAFVRRPPPVSLKWPQSSSQHRLGNTPLRQESRIWIWQKLSQNVFKNGFLIFPPLSRFKVAEISMLPKKSGVLYVKWYACLSSAPCQGYGSHQLNW